MLNAFLPSQTPCPYCNPHCPLCGRPLAGPGPYTNPYTYPVYPGPVWITYGTFTPTPNAPVSINAGGPSYPGGTGIDG